MPPMPPTPRFRAPSLHDMLLIGSGACSALATSALFSGGAADSPASFLIPFVATGVLAALAARAAPLLTPAGVAYAHKCTAIAMQLWLANDKHQEFDVTIKCEVAGNRVRTHISYEAPPLPTVIPRD